MSENTAAVAAEQEDGAHFYDQDGNPVYEVPNLKGGRSHKTTARDARKLDLLPSVSGISRMANRPGLNRWIIDQHVMSALTLPDTGESADERAKRVYRDATEQVTRASDFGTRIHNFIENFLAGNMTGDGLMASDFPFVEGIVDYLTTYTITPVELEFTFANRRMGYGGRVDCVGDVYELDRRCIIDWKTQRTVPGKPFRHYPEHGIQLIGYEYGIRDPEDEEELPGLNVLISSTEPGRIEPFLWLPGDKWRWPCFEALKLLYYSPMGPGKKLKLGLDPDYKLEAATESGEEED